MREYVYEILEKIEKADADKKVALIKEVGAKTPFNYLFSMNFNENMDLGIPEGMPPLSIYKRDEETHPDLFPGTLFSEMRRVVAIFQQKAAIAKGKREHIFLQVLEALPPKEADVLIYAKDHALTELYPSITYDLMMTIFPHYCHRKAEE